MSSSDNRDSTETASLRALSIAALIAMLVGAVGSLALMLYAGRHNPSRLLLLLFVIWVLSPFALLCLAHLVSKRWSNFTRAILYVVTLALAVSTLAIYAYRALGPPRAQAAFVFIVVPPASWLLIAIIFGLAALMSGGLTRQ